MAELSKHERRRQSIIEAMEQNASPDPDMPL
jgi:hypothetical protein